MLIAITIVLTNTYNRKLSTLAARKESRDGEPRHCAFQRCICKRSTHALQSHCVTRGRQKIWKKQR